MAINFNCWKKLEYLEKSNDLPQVTDRWKFYQVHFTTGRETITNDFSGNIHCLNSSNIQSKNHRKRQNQCPLTHNVHDCSLSWLGTPNTHVHDCSLSWLGTPNTHIHDCSLSWLGIGTSVLWDKIKPVSWAQII